jgi:hypothetical protein
MGVAMLTLSLFAWLGILVPFAIVFVFPAVVLALVLAFVLGARLFVAGKRRAVVVVVLGVNLLFTALLTWAVGSMIANRTKATPPHAAVEPSRGDVLACVAARTGPQRHYHIGPG